MGFSLRGIARAVGDFFTGGDDEERKRQQQQAYQAPQKASGFNAPQTVIQPQTSSSPQLPPDNLINLLQQPLQKAKPTLPALGANQPQIEYTPQPAQPEPPKKAHASILHNLTHNPVTNAAGNIGKSLYHDAGDAVDVVNAGRQGVQGLANYAFHPGDQSGQEILDKTKRAIDYSLNASHGLVSPDEAANADLFGTAEERGKFLNPVGRGTLRYAPYAVAPELAGLGGKAATTGVSMLAPEATARYLGATLLGLPADLAEQAAGKGLTKGIQYGSSALGGGLINTVFGGAGNVREGDSPVELLKKAPGNFGLGAGLGVAGTGLGDAYGGLKKAVTNDKPELSPGVKSSNPNQVVDAAKQMEAEKPVAPPLAVEQPAATPKVSVETPRASAAAIDPNEAAIQDYVKRGLITEEDAAFYRANAPKISEAPATPAAPAATSINDVAIQDYLDRGLITPEDAAFYRSNPEAISGPVKPAAELQPAAPPNGIQLQGGAPAPTTGVEVPVAPRTRQVVLSQLGDTAKKLGGDGKMRETVNLDDLKGNAASSVANLSDDDLLHAFSSPKLDGIPHDVNGVATIRASLDRLSELAKNDPKNPAIGDAIENALDGLAERSSQSGLIQRFIQEDFDSIPLPMKVRYLIKNIDRANREVKGYQALAEDPAKASVVEQIITNHLTDGEAISARIAETRGKLNDINEMAKSGQKSTADIRALTKQLSSDEMALKANNGRLIDYYDDLIPGRSLGQKTNDFARTMMLGSFAGRLNDIATTTANVVNQGLQNTTQGLLAKAINLVRPGTALDTLRGTKAFFQGTGEGLRKSGGEFKGANYVDDIQRALTDNTGARTGLAKNTNIVNRTIQNATEFATNASQGVRNQRLYQLAVKEGQAEGLKGDLLEQYAQTRAAVPTRNMLEIADNLHKQVNNLNENPISKALNRVSAGIASDKPGVAGTVSGVIKNQIIPFTSWLGGNIWNSVTDKNVVASAVKTVAAATKGDVDGVLAGIAKTANNAAYTYALGWLLTEKGVIVNHGPVDPNTGKSYNDAGAYFHIGDRYIPVAFSGFFAPSVILGNAAYNGINKNPGDPASGIADAAKEVIYNGFKAGNVDTALGTDNNITRAMQTASKDSSGVTGGAAQFGAGVAGQFIPAGTGDINSLLNNGVPGIKGSDALNPTHEAAQTSVKKINPETGNEVKDPIKSAEASLKNRVPLLSQTMPRKAGVAAPDFADRITKGSRDTNESNKVVADTKKKEDKAKYLKDNDIPDPNAKYKDGDSFDNAVQTRIEKGEYDKAIKAYQAQLDDLKANPNQPKSKQTELEKKIKTLEVTKGYDPSIIDTYKKTTLSEWRDMGDPESDYYDKKMYDLLYQYDGALADAAVSKNTTKASEHAYFAKKPGTGRGGGSANKKITSNTLGSTPDLKRIDFGDLAPRKVDSPKMPTIQQVKPGELIKKRTISVGKAR